MSLIKKIITGIAPPQLTDAELRKLYNLFNKVVGAFEETKQSDKCNTLYYPYLIYKILEYILPSDIRKKKILECIHLQSRDTLITNDTQWEKICQLMPTDIEYTPTDRSSQIIDY